MRLQKSRRKGASCVRISPRRIQYLPVDNTPEKESAIYMVSAPRRNANSQVYLLMASLSVKMKDSLLHAIVFLDSLFSVSFIDRIIPS